MTNAAQKKEASPSPALAAVEMPQPKKPQHDWTQYNRQQRNSLLKGLALCVLLPTLLSILYFGFIAAGQYQTEAHISLRSPQQAAAPSAFGALLTGVSGMNQSVQDVRSIAEYLQSHDAAKKLDETIGLRKMLSHPAADFLSRLPEDASFEKLLSHYRKHVKVVFNMDTSTVIVYVRAFTPEDAQALSEAILDLSEEVINGFNERAEEDGLRLAREELARAEKRVAAARMAIVEFREKRNDIDPASKSTAILGTITRLEDERNATEVRLRELSTFAGPENPELLTLKRRLTALEQQIRQEQALLTGSGDAYTKRLAQYEELMMEQEIAQQAYASALISMENARLEAQRQKSYVVPIVHPHMAQNAEYPQRLRNIALTLIASLLGFGILRLVVAGIRDHVMH